MKRLRLGVLLAILLGFTFIGGIGTEAKSPKIGVLFSETSEKYADIVRPGGTYKGQTVSPKEDWSSIYDKELKMFHLYEEQGFNPIKLSEKDLLKRDYMGEFDAIAFPYTVLLNHAERQAVKEYIRDGGGAIFAYGMARNESSVYPAAGKMDLTALIYHTETWIWEWDNLSEVFQSGFVNDVVLKDYTIGAASSTHEIMKNTEKELGRKFQAKNTRPSGDWIEVIAPYTKEVVPLLQYDAFTYSSSPKHTPKNTGAAYAMEYGKGRVVFSGYKLYDHFGVEGDSKWEDASKGAAYSGTTGDEDTKVFLKHSLNWAAKDVQKVKPQTYSVAMSFNDLRGYLRASDYSFYGTVTTSNDGVAPIRGTIVVEVSDSNGKVLKSYSRYLPGLTPKGGSLSAHEEKFHLQLPKSTAHGKYKLSVTFHEGKDGEGYRIKSTVKDVTIGKGNAVFANPPSFKDVAQSNGMSRDISNLSNLGIIRGFTDGTFKPGDPIKRVQAAEMMLKSANIPVRTGLGINATDMKKGDYGYDIVATAVSAGILAIENGKVRAHTSMSRGEMGQALVSGFGLKAYGTASFQDVPVSSPAKGAIATIYALGVTTGYPDGTFKPNETVSRQQFSAFVNRSLTAIQR